MGIVGKQTAITLVTLILLGGLGVGYTLFEPALRTARAEQMTEELARRGANAFDAQGCKTCHLETGYGNLQGGAGWALNTTQNQRGSETELEARRDVLYRAIARGRPGTPMAAYAREEGGPLNSEQINALVAYIQYGHWPVAPVEGEGARLAQGGVAGGSRGAQLFQAQGCGACHQLNDQNLQGPGLGGIGTRAAERKPGTDAATYLRESIVNPNAFIVPGFQPNVMPGTYGQTLMPDEIDALVEYMLELK